MALWDADLTVTPQYIADHPVFCAVQGDEIVGFYALLRQGDTFELEHMWVDPRHLGAGIGAHLFEHAVRTVQSLGGSRLTIVSEPHAKGFYRRMGARRTGETPSKPAGRTEPLLTLAIDADDPGLGRLACNDDV